MREVPLDRRGNYPAYILPMDDKPLLRDVEAFRAKHQMADSTFGRLAANDWKLISQLREGRWLRPPTEAKVRAFMAEYRPAAEPERSAA